MEQATNKRLRHLPCHQPGTAVLELQRRLDRAMHEGDRGGTARARILDAQDLSDGPEQAKQAVGERHAPGRMHLRPSPQDAVVEGDSVGGLDAIGQFHVAGPEQHRPKKRQTICGPSGQCEPLQGGARHPHMHDIPHRHSLKRATPKTICALDGHRDGGRYRIRHQVRAVGDENSIAGSRRSHGRLDLVRRRAPIVVRRCAAAVGRNMQDRRTGRPCRQQK